MSSCQILNAIGDTLLASSTSLQHQLFTFPSLTGINWNFCAMGRISKVSPRYPIMRISLKPTPRKVWLLRFHKSKYSMNDSEEQNKWFREKSSSIFLVLHNDVQNGTDLIKTCMALESCICLAQDKHHIPKTSQQLYRVVAVTSYCHRSGFAPFLFSSLSPFPQISLQCSSTDCTVLRACLHNVSNQSAHLAE